MDWLTAIRNSIEYMESHLEENISVQDVSDRVNISGHIFGKGFGVMTGYSISEYIRGRRLYLAALALRDTDKSVLDIALDACYDTPESFSKAFTRFHGNTPSAVRGGAAFKTFLPLRIQLSTLGGKQLECKITRMFGLKLIGFQEEFSMDKANQEIERFWDVFYQKYARNVYAGNPPANVYEQALMDNSIGEYGVCIDDLPNNRFRYMIAGRYTGGEIPPGMVLYEFPMGEWAVFDCVGPMPEALQSLNTRVFNEWLQDNTEYELSRNANVEWYDSIGEKTDPDYRSAIWFPVKRK